MVFLEEYKEEDFSGDKVFFPLKNGGRIYYAGSEISTTWVIDSNGQVWIDGLFGSLPFTKTTKVKLLKEEKNLAKREVLRKELGMKSNRPEWMTQALKEGWTPPKDWVDPQRKKT